MPLRAFFLVGPTASGKTAVAHQLARTTGVTLISADSMQVYRGMDIGTAKPNAWERDHIRYWGLDCVEPDMPFSAGDYLQAIRKEAAAETGTPRRLIVVGGTGLYVDVLLRGISARPPMDSALRERLDALHRVGGVVALQAELDRVAPGRRAELADDRNPRRLIRAIEGAAQGVLSARQLDPRPEKPLLVGLAVPMPELQERIRQRVRTMYAGGLLEEADALRKRYPAISKTAVQAIGYAEAWACLDGRISRAEAEETTVVRTRQLAKRQMTWFRHQARMCWIEAGGGRPVDEVARDVETAWEQNGPSVLQF